MFSKAFFYGLAVLFVLSICETRAEKDDGPSAADIAAQVAQDLPSGGGGDKPGHGHKPGKPAPKKPAPKKPAPKKKGGPKKAPPKKTGGKKGGGKKGGGRVRIPRRG